MFKGLVRKFIWATLASGFVAYSMGMTKGPQQIYSLVKEIQAIRNQPTSYEKPRLNSSDIGAVQAPTLNESEVKHTFNGREYVVIEGRYYEYRPDHIYTVKGRRLFYFNSRAHTEVAATEKIAQADIKTAGMERTPSSEDNDILSPDEALKKIRELQGQMKDRNDYLDKLSVGGN